MVKAEIKYMMNINSKFEKHLKFVMINLTLSATGGRDTSKERLWRGTKTMGLGGTHPKGTFGHIVWVHDEIKKKISGSAAAAV